MPGSSCRTRCTTTSWPRSGGGPSGSGWERPSTRGARSVRWCRRRTAPRSRTTSRRRWPRGRGWSRVGSARRADAAEGLLLPADRARRRAPRDARGPGGDVRPDAHRGALLLRGRGRRAGQRHRFTGWPVRCGPPTWAGPSGWRAGTAAGTVWINDYHPYIPQAEWGGFKQSGIGRELGPTGLAEYQEAQAHLAQHRAAAAAVVRGDRAHGGPAGPRALPRARRRRSPSSATSQQLKRSLGNSTPSPPASATSRS